MKNTYVIGYVTSFLFGMLFGVVIAVLVTPQSGTELRARIGEKASVANQRLHSRIGTLFAGQTGETAKS